MTGSANNNNNNNQIIPFQSTPTLLGMPREIQQHISFFISSRRDLRHFAASNKLSRTVQLKALIESERESRAGYGPLSQKLSLKGFSEDENSLNQLYILLRGNHEIHTWCRSQNPSKFSCEEERTDFHTFLDDPGSKKYILYQTQDDQATQRLPEFFTEPNAWLRYGRFQVYRRDGAKIQLLSSDVVVQKLNSRIQQLLDYLKTDEETIDIHLKKEGLLAVADSFKDDNPLLLQDLAYCYFLLVDFYHDNAFGETIAQQYSLFSAIYALAAARASENTLMASFILLYRIFNNVRKVTSIVEGEKSSPIHVFRFPFLSGDKEKYFTDEIKQAVVDCLAMGLGQEKALVTEALTSSSLLIRPSFPSFTFLEILRGFFIVVKQFGINNAKDLLDNAEKFLCHPNNLAKWIEAGLAYDSLKGGGLLLTELMLSKNSQAYLILFKKLEIDVSEGVRFLKQFPQEAPRFLLLLPRQLIKGEIQNFQKNKPIIIKNWLVNFLNGTEISLANWTSFNVRKLTHKVTIIKQVFLKYDEKTVMAIHDEIKKLPENFLTALVQQCKHYAWLLTAYPLSDLFSLFKLSDLDIKGATAYRVLCSNQKIAEWFLTNKPSTEQLIEKVHQEYTWVGKLLNGELRRKNGEITLIDLLMRHYSVPDLKLLQNVRINNNDETALEMLLHALGNSAYTPFCLDNIYSNNDSHQPRISLLGILMRMDSQLSSEFIEKVYKQTPEQNQKLFDEFYKNPEQTLLVNITATSTWQNGTSLFAAPNTASKAIDYQTTIAELQALAQDFVNHQQGQLTNGELDNKIQALQTKCDKIRKSLNSPNTTASVNNNSDTTHKRTMDLKLEEEEEEEVELIKRQKL